MQYHGTVRLPYIMDFWDYFKESNIFGTVYHDITIMAVPKTWYYHSTTSKKSMVMLF